LPDIEFVSIGGVIEGDKPWLEAFSKDMPPNYTLKTNLPSAELVETLQNSRVYVHLMEGEHFGIAPIEGLASGCVTLVHNSGGMKEFLPDEYRWDTYEDLKAKILNNVTEQSSENWENKRKQLWSKISILNPKTFENNIWSHVESLIQQP